MRTFTALTILLLVSAVPVMAQSAADEAAVKAATKQAIDTDNKRDIEAHLEVYAHPFIGLQGETDREAHGKAHTDIWARSKDSRVEMVEEMDVVFLSPDVAIHRFTQEFTGGIDEDGKAIPPSKRAIARIYVKTGGKWLVGANFFRDLEE